MAANYARKTGSTGKAPNGASEAAEHAGNVLVVDQHGAITACGTAIPYMLDLAAERLVGGPVRELLPGLPLDAATTGYNVAYLTFWAACGDARRLGGRGGNGGDLLFDVVVRPYGHGRARTFALELRPVAATADSRDLDRLIAAVETSREPVLVVSATGQIDYANPAYEQLTGYRRAKLVGRPWHVLQQGIDPATADAMLWESLRRSRTETPPTVRRTRFGHPVHTEDRIRPFVDAAGRITHFVVVAHDVTERVHAIEQLTHEATHDQLTGLANRRLLTERLRRAIERTERLGRGFAVVCMDLDGFKTVNDQYGHACGDALLAKVATSLKRFVREGDTVARAGGDEFVAILQDVGSREEADAVVQRMIESIAVRCSCKRATVNVSVSAGVSLYPEHGSDGDVLLQRADKAMYVSKLMGGDTFSFAGERRDVERSGRVAKTFPLVLVGQPKEDCDVPASCVAAWQHKPACTV
jgi:diguanylate cyclase (GGDEF)-like protein/PAS domain S-box-containing protein